MRACVCRHLRACVPLNGACWRWVEGGPEWRARASACVCVCLLASLATSRCKWHRANSGFCAHDAPWSPHLCAQYTEPSAACSPAAPHQQHRQQRTHWILDFLKTTALWSLQLDFSSWILLVVCLTKVSSVVILFQPVHDARARRKKKTTLLNIKGQKQQQVLICGTKASSFLSRLAGVEELGTFAALFPVPEHGNDGWGEPGQVLISLKEQRRRNDNFCHVGLWIPPVEQSQRDRRV